MGIEEDLKEQHGITLREYLEYLADENRRCNQCWTLIAERTRLKQIKNGEREYRNEPE